MQLSQFRTKVAAYANRDVSAFIVNGFDLLTDAINQARRWAQLVHDFEYLRVRAQLPVSFQTGGYLSNCTLVDATSSTIPVQVKKVEKAFIQIVTGNNTTTYSQAGLPIKVYSRWVDAQRQERLYSGRQDWGYPNNIASPTLTPHYNDISLIVQNNQVYFSPGVRLMYPSVNTLTIVMDVIAFQPDLVNDSDSDFFTSFCNPWLTSKTLQVLNAYLKEDERMQIMTQIEQQQWTAVLAWDESIAGQDDGDLM